MRRIFPVLVISVVSLGFAIAVVLIVGGGNDAEPSVATSPAADLFSQGVLTVQPEEASPSRAVIERAPAPVKIPVEIAASNEARARGLTGRESLPEGTGMVFLFTEPREGGFWMKDTLIPLRIGFWDEEGVVLAIRDMVPCEADPCPSYDPDVAYVGAVEASEAMFEEAGLEVGSRVTVEGT